MFESLRIAGVWHNRSDRDYADWPAPADILRAATSGSAHVLGLGGDTGVIEAGRLADMVLLTTESLSLRPLNNVINQLVYCENGISVTDVMIDGRWVLRGGKLLTVDEKRSSRGRGRFARRWKAGCASSFARRRKSSRRCGSSTLRLRKLHGRTSPALEWEQSRENFEFATVLVVGEVA
jgi:hypothetical protein